MNYNENLAAFKELAKHQSLGIRTSSWIKIIIPIIICIGLFLSFYSLFTSTKGSEGYGMNTVIVNPDYYQKYDHTAYTIPNYQIWALRSAQGSTSNVTLTLQGASEMKNGAIVVVRNSSARVPTGNEGNTTNVPTAVQVIVSSSITDTLQPYSVTSSLPDTSYVAYNNKWYRYALPQ